MSFLEACDRALDLAEQKTPDRGTGHEVSRRCRRREVSYADQPHADPARLPDPIGYAAASADW